MTKKADSDEKGELILEKIISKKDLEALYNHIELIKEKYDIKDKEIKLVIEKEMEDMLPTSIFSKELGVAEAVVKYLRENQDYSNKEIAKLLNKSQNSVAVIYKKAKSKSRQRFKKISFKNAIPYSKLSSPRLTTFESIVLYLKESSKLSFHEIAEIMHRDDRTIWTTYKRASNKNG